jgi:hypothetical protein
MVTAGLVGGQRWNRLALVPLMVLAALMVLVNPGWRIAPRTWFVLHRPLFESAHTDSAGGPWVVRR